MSDNRETLIHLDAITKVFYTDEVETHALAGVHFDIRKGEYVSISGPSGCGKSPISTTSTCTVPFCTAGSMRETVPGTMPLRVSTATT